MTDPAPVAPCWCGEETPYYSDDIDDRCGGSYDLFCRCGGDQCVCHNHGTVECPGCDDCYEPGFDDPADPYNWTGTP